MASLYPYCPDGSFDAGTNTCVALAWREETPLEAAAQLGVDDALLLAFQVGVIWATAWSVKRVLKFSGLR